MMGVPSKGSDNLMITSEIKNVEGELDNTVYCMYILYVCICMYILCTCVYR